MLPFDRLIRAADAWAEANPNYEMFAQIGDGEYVPAKMHSVRMLMPAEFNAKVRIASLIVSHAGMGTVISAMQDGKRVVIMPRRAADREATTDHQVHTIEWLKGKQGVYVAESENDLPAAIESALRTPASQAVQWARMAPEDFVHRIRSFILR